MGSARKKVRENTHSHGERGVDVEGPELLGGLVKDGKVRLGEGTGQVGGWEDRLKGADLRVGERGEERMKRRFGPGLPR